MIRTAVRATILALSIFSLADSATAGEITIGINGINAVYDGFDLYDSGSPFGGNQNASESDPLTSVVFYDDGILLGTLTTSIHADFAIVGVNDILIGGGTSHSSFGGFFDLLTGPDGWGLGLDFDSFDLAYDGGTGLSATGLSSGIVGQSLPFGLVVAGPIRVKLDFGLSKIANDGTFVTGFDADGRATLPEPAALLLFGLGGLVVARRVRRA